MAKHLLVDFGEVISEPQTALAVQELASLADMPTDTFLTRYWASRASYDLGQPAQAYWEEVVGRTLKCAELSELRRVDLASWTHLNFATINALRHVHQQGAQLTLLSNAPHDLARTVARSAVLTDIFSLMLFSAELRLAKPTEEVFDIALTLAEHCPADTLFIDDRIENLRAAEVRGIQTHHFTTPSALDKHLRGVDFRTARGARQVGSRQSVARRPNLAQLGRWTSDTLSRKPQP